MTKERKSPFTPGSPVPFELFVGRASQIMEITRSISQSVVGRQQNIFLVGDRGVGKTSIASFIRYLADTRENVLGIHVFLGGVDNLQEMTRRIFDNLLTVTKGEKWFTKVRSMFGDFVREIGLFGVSVGFEPPKKDLDQLVRNFPQALYNLASEISDEKNGLFIVLDDLDELSTVSEFANWYKSFADKVATHFSEYHVSLMLIGLPNTIDSLSDLQPSLMRIFKVIELEKLSNSEVTDFFQKAFTEANKEVDEDALKLMVRFSSGVPVVMHEIGDAVFWHDEDDHIDEDDAFFGVLLAAERIGKKYLDPQVYRAVRSSSYRSILRKLGLRETPLNRNFTRKEVVEYLTEKEQKAFDNFLRRLKQIGIIEFDRDKGRGVYCFVNDIYPVYIFMEARAYDQKYGT